MPQSILVDHWRKLEGSVHPDDERVFSTANHTFNLDWPSPAYVGDIENAPYVILMKNGGYDANMTPAEFPDEASVER